MKKMTLAFALCAAMLPGFAQADPPPYDPISICDIPKGECYPERLPDETRDFACSLVARVGECKI
ncbi:MAG TPA: hypothetical protein VM841_04140 [Actinomycetota bacterium]|nr:hypothetical protein [Actinomycetota bacterium]